MPLRDQGQARQFCHQSLLLARAITSARSSLSLARAKRRGLRCAIANRGMTSQTEQEGSDHD
jgi:hypothetical protein